MELRPHLQLMTGHQEYASFDELPPRLRPRGVIFGGVLPQLERRRHGFGETNAGADAVTLTLRAVGRRRPLDPHVAVHLRGETGNELISFIYLSTYLFFFYSFDLFFLSPFLQTCPRLVFLLPYNFSPSVKTKSNHSNSITGRNVSYMFALVVVLVLSLVLAVLLGDVDCTARQVGQQILDQHSRLAGLLDDADVEVQRSVS